MLMSVETPCPDLKVRTFSNGLVSFEDSDGLKIVLPQPSQQALALNDSITALSSDFNVRSSEDGIISCDNGNGVAILIPPVAEQTCSSNATAEAREWECASPASECLHADCLAADNLARTGGATSFLPALEGTDVPIAYWWQDHDAEIRHDKNRRSLGLKERDYNRFLWFNYYLSARRGVPGHLLYDVPNLSERSGELDSRLLTFFGRV